jgi:hypothetical protein
MLAYVTWHAPAPGVDIDVFEEALTAFHHSLARVPPSGFRGSMAFRVSRLPALGGEGGWGDGDVQAYEDWYLLDNWDALGVLEEAAVSRGHLTRHRAVSEHSAGAVGGVYRLSEGHADLAQARIAAWVTPARDHAPPTVADLLGDGMDRAGAGLWRRSLGLGPAPEYCLLASEPPAGLGPERLPAGWRAVVQERTALAPG